MDCLNKSISFSRIRHYVCVAFSFGTISCRHYKTFVVSQRLQSTFLPPASCAHFDKSCLASLVHAKRNDVRIDHAQIERRQEHVGVGQGNEHRAVNERSAILVHRSVGLVGVARVRTGDCQRRVGRVELRHPHHVGWIASNTALAGDVAVVGPDQLARAVPLEKNLLAGERQRLRTVTADGRAAAVTSHVQVDAALVLRRDGRRAGSAVVGPFPEASIVGRDTVDVGLVRDVERREVLPCQTSSVLGARADVRREVGPLPGLRDASLEPNVHWNKPRHLAESHLLAGLGGDRLSKELTDLARVKVIDEPPNTRLAPASDDLHEINPLTRVSIRVVVGALRRRRLANHVGDESCVALLLLCHEPDMRDILRSQAVCEHLLVGEDGDAVVEKVKLDPLLIQTKN